MVFFSLKIIPMEILYKTNNQRLLIIVKVFKTWCHYLKGCKYKVFVVTDHNNFYKFVNTKNLRFK